MIYPRSRYASTASATLRNPSAPRTSYGSPSIIHSASPTRIHSVSPRGGARFDMTTRRVRPARPLWGRARTRAQHHAAQRDLIGQGQLEQSGLFQRDRRVAALP